MTNKTKKIKSIRTITLGASEQIKTHTGSIIVKQVTHFNDTKVQDNRLIYLDNKRYFWYNTGDDRVYRYHIKNDNCQVITVAGTAFVAYKNDLKDENVTALDVDGSCDLKVGGIYRLRNGVKMQLVSCLAEGEFASEATFVGVYKDGTIRFSARRKLLSHGGDQNWAIVSEWKEVDLWQVTSLNGNGQYLTHNFKSEADANEFKRKSANVVAINKITV